MRTPFTPRALIAGVLLLPLLLVNCKEGGGTGPTPSGTVTGQVVNALTGAPVASVTVNFGSNRSTTTNAAGSFTMTLPEGTYTATISGAGFANTIIEGIAVAADATTNLGTLGISPPLAAGQVRVILTWNQGRDLDSHLRGPIPNSSDRFHVYFASTGNANASPFAFLDRDDLNGPGPETVTITQLTPGVYRYAVHDYTGGNSAASNSLAQSRARVRVIRGSDQVADFTVPNQAGTLWTVFEMNGATGQITPVNTMSGQSPGTLQSANPGTTGSAGWLIDMQTIAEAVAAQPKS